MQILVAKEFSRAPGPRYISEGPYSGESFRKEILCPRVKEAIQKGETLDVVLDGTHGFGTSFLEEAFGGLIREDELSYQDIMSVLNIISEEEDYLIDDIKQYLLDASQANEKGDSLSN